ncbi:hypothetical protein MRBLWH7_000121 [Microbacterium sp. LWH7-1.2]|uniref:hypothetical protein n=1 Tax=Microbacterium sp. LWH7-1.2 TaxID=3135257 RepID=UPI0031397386
MTTDNARERALIAEMRAIERQKAATAYKPPVFTPEQERAIVEGNVEIDRIARGDADVPADVAAEIARIVALD